MNAQQQQQYKSFRQTGIPANRALAIVRAGQTLEAKKAETGFEWVGGRARWQQDGFYLTAVAVVDENGWDAVGVNTLGKFTDKRQPGTIKHRHGDRNSCEWFLPANPEYGREDYRRACAFGKDWEYLGITVKAYRAGVELGSASLWGIESDSGEEYLTEVAFELAGEATAEAAKKLEELRHG